MSCLFNSLQFFIKEDSFTIRQKICDYLLANGQIMEGLDTSFILQLESNCPAKYIDQMKNTSTWGGAIEIQCACNIWALTIKVQNRRDGKNEVIEFVPVTRASERTIELYWTGGHYEPVR